MARRRRKSRSDKQAESIAFGLLIIGGWFYWQWTAATIPRAWLIAVAVLFPSMLAALLPALAHWRRSRLTRRGMAQLTPGEFERRIGLLLADLGWTSIQHVGGSGDRGVDLRGIWQEDSYVVQCKHKQKVSAADMRDFVGTLVNQHAQRGLFVTSGRYTDPARKEAQGNPIELWDRDDLVNRISQVEAARQSPQTQRRQRWRWIAYYSSLIAINILVILWAHTGTPFPL